MIVTIFPPLIEIKALRLPFVSNINPLRWSFTATMLSLTGLSKRVVACEVHAKCRRDACDMQPAVNGT